MREIKFRARRVRDGEWVYGYINYRGCVNRDSWYMYSGGFHTEVDGKTVGQYTGLPDKNGLIEIFEGDIVIAGNRGTGVVEWYAGGFITRFDARRYELINNHVEVIGNIHENKELLHGND